MGHFPSWRVLRKYLKYTCLAVLTVCIIHVFMTIVYIYSTYFIQSEQMADASYVDRFQQTASGYKHSVPRIVHQMWKTDQIPQQWKFSATSWKINNPNVTYILWNDYTLGKFISDSYPWLLDLYQSYSLNIQRADMARYVLLFHFGGLYADLDIENRMSLNAIFHKLDTGNYTVGVAPTSPYGFTNDMIFAKPHSNFMKQVILGLKFSNRWFYLPYWTVMLSTGSLYFTGVIKRYPLKEDIFVISQECYMYSCFRHLPGGSWHGADGKIIWSLFHDSFDMDLIIIILCIICIVLISCCMVRDGKCRRL